MNMKLIQLSVVVSLTILTACSSKQKTETINNTDAPIMVTVATPQSNSNNSIDVTGQVEAATAANISTKVMGYITSMKVKVGDRVSKGQLLAIINSDDIAAKKGQVEANINEAEAAFRNAQKDVDRFTALHKQQSATDKELENVTLQYQSIKAKLEMAKQMRNEVSTLFAYTNLTAPFGGIVTQKFADAGSMANPGMPLLTIEQDGTFQVSIAVPESNISQIKQGAIANIFISSINRNIKGNIAQINQSSQFSGGQYIVKIAIAEADKKGLYSGMYANVSMPVTMAKTIDNTASVLIPVSSIEKKNQLNGIYTISSSNTALLRWIKLGKVYGDKVEVLSGLEPNENFVVSADGKLYNGAPIKTK